MQKFLKVVTSYLQKKMSLDSELLKDLTCLHPNAKGQDRSVRAIGRIARALSHVVEESQISLIRDEFKAYHTEHIPDDWFQVQKDNGEVEYKRIDEYWNKVLTITLPNEVKKYNLLAKVVKSALCIHHGNSDVERSLSDNKNTVTPERASLNAETINGLRRAKDFVNKTAGSVHNVTISKEMIQAGRTAHRAYKRKLEEEKEAEDRAKRRKLAQEEVQRNKREQLERIEKEKETLNQNEKDLKTVENKEKEEIKTAENLINEGSQRLNSAISKKDFTEVQVASALIDGAKKKIASARKKLDEIIKERRKIDERKSKMIDDMKSSK